MINREQLIAIGHYNKPHGVNGELSATFDVDVELLPHFSCLVSDIDGIYVPFFVEGVRAKNVSTALVDIDGINDETEATLLVNKEIFVLKTQYEQLSHDEDSDEYPPDYFIGFKVWDGDDFVGNVTDVNDATQNVLFVIKREDGTEVNVPAVDDLILEIDEKQKKIVMNLPEGLLSI